MRTFNTIFLLTAFLFGIQESRAQIENDIEVADSVQGNVEQEKFEQLMFKAISQRGIEAYEKAIQTLTEIENDVKDNAVVYFQLGLNYFDIEEYNLALLNFEKARALKATDRDISEAIFKVYNQQDNYQSAIEEAKGLVESDKGYLEILADLYFKAGEYDKAYSFLERADKAFGYSAARENKRVMLFNTTQDYELATSYYTKRKQLEPFNPYNYYRLATFLSLNNEHKKAVEVTEELIQQHPYFTRAYVLQTSIFVRDNQPEEALKALETVVADRLLEEKYKVEAIEVFKGYLKNHPEYQQQFIDVLNAATQTAEDNASYLDLAEFYFKTDKAKSLENYYKALEQNPQDYKILSAISVLNFQLQNFEAVVKITDQALEIYPSQVIFMLYKGKSLLNLKQYEESKSVLVEALDYMYEENAMMLEAYESLYAVYQALGDTENALDYKNKADKLKSQLE